MTREVKLTADQQAKINGLITAYQTALDGWTNKNNSQIDKLQKDLRAAEQAKKAEEARKLRTQLTALLQEQVTLQAKYQQDIIDVLTPEQRAAWAGVSAYEQGEFAMIRQLVKLTPEQETKLKAQAKAYAAAETKWETANGEKARKLEGQIRAAQAELNALQAAQEKIEADNHAAILAILTAQQKTELTAAELQQVMSSRLAPVKLTEKQAARVTSLCQTAAVDLNKLPEADRNARLKVLQKLTQSIDEQVLTAAQRASLKNAQ
ncbi:MAG: Spy/CpxP family protein refolding chaperone [Armatimonadota bacterium]